jgi:hypothetical protein
MSALATSSKRALIGAQMLGALLVFACVALAPPAEGNMLLVPVAPQSEGRVVALALTRGASVIQRGPLPSSVIVYGRRDSLFGPLARAGILTLAGGAVGCRPAKGNVA